MYILKKALSSAIRKIKVLPSSSYPVTPKVAKLKAMKGDARVLGAKEEKKNSLMIGAGESEDTETVP